MNRLVRTWLNITSVSIPTQWEMTKAKRAHVKEHNECEVCGYKKKLEAHHVVPVHIAPDKGAEPDNLITLCRSCHFTFGHFHNFRKYWNPSIKSYAKYVRKRYNTYYLQILNLLLEE